MVVILEEGIYTLYIVQANPSLSGALLVVGEGIWAYYAVYTLLGLQTFVCLSLYSQVNKNTNRFGCCMVYEYYMLTNHHI